MKQNTYDCRAVSTHNPFRRVYKIPGLHHKGLPNTYMYFTETRVLSLINAVNHRLTLGGRVLPALSLVTGEQFENQSSDGVIQ